MRAATLVAILALHLGLALLFLTLHAPTLSKEGAEAPVTVLLPWIEPAQPTQPPNPAALPLPTGSNGHSARHAPIPPAADAQVTVPENPTPPAITVPVAPDWHQEAQTAAADALLGDERRRRNPSLLAPHDFSAVPHGAVDDTKPRFGWSYAATHRVESLEGGGFLLNINDRCAVAIVIMVMPFCRIGKIATRGDLFEHMDDPAP
jgi:hypothetical protein